MPPRPPGPPKAVQPKEVKVTVRLTEQEPKMLQRLAGGGRFSAALPHVSHPDAPAALWRGHAPARYATSPAPPRAAQSPARPHARGGGPGTALCPGRPSGRRGASRRRPGDVQGRRALRGLPISATARGAPSQHCLPPLRPSGAPRCLPRMRVAEEHHVLPSPGAVEPRSPSGLAGDTSGRLGASDHGVEVARFDHHPHMAAWLREPRRKTQRGRGPADGHAHPRDTGPSGAPAPPSAH